MHKPTPAKSQADDRNQTVPIWTGTGRTSDPFEQDLSLRLANVAQQRMQRLGLLIGPLAALSFVFFNSLGLPVWSALFPCAVLMAAMLLISRWFSDVERSKIKPSLLNAGRCASCAYPIAKLPPEHDGCVTCPECGAAWKYDADWARRMAVADQAAEENLGPRKGETAEDQETVQWMARLFGGLSGRRNLAMRDDRGRLARIFFPRFPWKNPHGWNQVNAEVRKKLKRETRLLGWPMRLFFAICILVPVGFQFWALSRLPGNLGSMGLMRIMLGLWFFVFLPLALFGFAAFPYVRKPQKMARIFLRRGLCPGCWSDLTLVQLNPDGARECTHCLSAWKLDGDAYGTAVTDSTSPTHTPQNPPTAPRSG